MAWNVTGELIETCSCNMLCPCWYGVRELMVMDQGWCGSPLLIRIREGSSDGVDLSGCDVVFAAFYPGPTILDGNGTARVYVDERATDDQRRELEAIFQARKGGPMEVPASFVATWLPTQTTRIEVKEDRGTLTATVGKVGQILSTRLKNEKREQMTMQNTGFVLAFQFKDQTADLAPSEGGQWNDPDIPEQWMTKSGAVGQIAWSVS
ncbi:MAG: DUF1326 domain-containing protein [Myxococcota bacterium]